MRVKTHSDSSILNTSTSSAIGYSSAGGIPPKTPISKEDACFKLIKEMEERPERLRHDAVSRILHEPLDEGARARNEKALQETLRELDGIADPATRESVIRALLSVSLIVSPEASAAMASVTVPTAQPALLLSGGPAATTSTATSSTANATVTARPAAQ